MRLYFLLRLLLELGEQEQGATARLEQLKVLLPSQAGLALFIAGLALTSWASSLISHAIFFTRWANLFIYQARESSLVPAGFLTVQFLQKT